MMIYMEFGHIRRKKMKQKIILIFIIMALTLIYAKPKCNAKTYAMLDNYIIKRKQFVKLNHCFDDDSFIYNSDTNQTVDLLGKVTGLKRFYQSDIEILQINTFAGAHTHIVYFYKIEENGTLSDIENGIIGSDMGEPIIFKSDTRDILTVTKYYEEVDEKYEYLYEDVYNFENVKFVQIVKRKMLKKWNKKGQLIKINFPSCPRERKWEYILNPKNY